MSESTHEKHAPLAMAIEAFAENLGVKIALKTTMSDATLPSGPNDVPNVTRTGKKMGL